jgi:hypothetical protein
MGDGNLRFIFAVAMAVIKEREQCQHYFVTGWLGQN